VKPILLLEEAVPRTSAESFDGHPILFSDSVIKLREQVGLAEEALGIFNSIASHSHFRQMDKKEISDSLVSEVEQQVSCRSIIARDAETRARAETQADHWGF